MKCPHCLVTVHLGQINSQSLGFDHTEETVQFAVKSINCPNCNRLIAWLNKSWGYQSQSNSIGVPLSGIYQNSEEMLIWPKGTNRSPLPPEVSAEFAEDYEEACLILADSPKASAALSRRCLQHLLREKAGVKHSTLYKEIEEVVNSGLLPPTIVEIIDVPRKVGNAAAHPLEDDAGLIVPVETWQAEWCLEVIEELFDYYFVTPARTAERLKRLGL